MQDAVERVIEMMHQKLGERITIDEMARTALFSKFYFTRMFQRYTGVSPSRFLSAIRIQEAKRLLLATSLSVADISNQVGYTSVGTFSSTFKRCVGLAPTAYRQLEGFALGLPADSGWRNQPVKSATIRGIIHPPVEEGGHGLIFAGLFPSWIPQGSPIRCTILRKPGPLVFEDVPQGTWYLLAQAHPYIGRYGPITIHPNTIVSPANLRLRPATITDPPVLLALPDERLVALEAIAG